MVDRPVFLTTQLILLLCLFGWRGNTDDFFIDALQYETLDNYGTTEECALVLDGPGRSSAYDYTYNLLRGSQVQTSGSHTCITYDAVNRAYIEARKRVNIAQPHANVWRPEDLATVGELLLDISTTLAQMYGLTYEEIQNGLPRIDTSKTLIRDICPAFLSDVECRPGKYRRYDGLCTNLENPTWGATLSPFTRLLNPAFPDGLSAPRISVTGDNLPLSRVVSRTMHPDEGYHDHAGTVMVIAWGQFMDHDYTLTGTPLDPLNRNDPEECCHRPPHQKNPYCNEIIIPEDDYFYRLFGVRCMDFVRAFPAARPGCRLGSRVPFNLLTGVLDGNTVYGISETFARKLRTGYGGLLRMNPVFSEYGLKDLLPLKLDIPDEGCTRPNKSMYCFEAGEIRVNEQLVLTCMHTLLAREHNRAAKALSQVNPHWDDETIFQEARRIIIAEIQHITYNEFLPILLGKDVMEKFGLLLEKHNYWDGYDSTVNPGVIDAFAAAAFRFGHSLLPTAVERWSKAHKFIASKRLSDLIRRPWDLYRAGVIDEYFMGLMNQVAQAMDDSITQEVTNHLFKKVGARFGMDLVSLNMQRGREFGIPSYMEFRKFCGLPGADTFEGLFGSMPNETIRRYSSIFQHPSDVDLWSGGVSERPLPGSMLGPTFACVIATQFSYSRRGDRFWYELPNQPSSFTLDQLNEIRKARLARLICDNTDLIDTIQIYPMVLPDHEINPRVPCRSGILPGIDFSKWAEYPTTSHAAQYSDDTKAFLPPPIGVAPINRESGKIIRSGKTSEIYHKSVPKIGLIYRPKKKILKHRIDERLKKKSILFKLMNYFPRRNSNRDVIKVTTIVEHIRNRSKRHIESRLESKNLENISKRQKRSTEKIVKENLKSSAEKKQNDRLSKLAIFYLHPRLPIEEEKEESREARTIEANVLNRKNRSENQTEKNETKKSLYEPIFKECNETAASEVEDLNIPPPRNKFSKPPKPFIPDIDSPEEEKSVEKIEAQKIVLNSSKITESEDPIMSKKSSEISPSTSKKFIYVNLRDHQEESKIKNRTDEIGNEPISTSLRFSHDTKPYNPDDIPYVEVPDYTDQREESLDKDDEKIGSGKTIADDVKDDDFDNDQEDVVNPDVPEHSKMATTNPESPRNKDESESLEDRYKDKPGDRLSKKIEDVKNNDRKKEEKSTVIDENAKIENKSRLINDRLENVEKSVSDFTPVEFNIEDYIRPFTSYDLFKKDDSKNEERKTQFNDDDTGSLERSFDRYHRSDEQKSKDFQFDDKDFFKTIFGDDRKKPNLFFDESDSHSRYFDDGIDDRLENDENRTNKNFFEKSDEEDKEDSYETLPTNVDKNDDTSKFINNKNNESTRSNYKPKNYHKFWTLEYAFPSAKIKSNF